ncbi:MAG: Uma2 family endonuclease, partial [Prochloron sp. SP5CPC1]|nr:Uma2 family endonuclease [Candidatus Paraprochloron terpiosi SP5CPC1]
KPKIRQAPDVMVVFGREKGDRGSYKQWEEGNIPPQAVFEIASPSNTIKELEETKHGFYEHYGVEEYYLFYPERGVLKGWLRRQETLEPISNMSGWISPHMSVRFEVINQKLQLFRSSGEPFATYVEIMEQRERERERADMEFRRAEQEFQRAEQESQRAQRAEKELTDAVPRLLAMGLSIQQVAAALNLPLEAVREQL